MDQLSPITRRIVAVGLAVLVLLLAIQYVVVPLAAAIGSQRDELASLRQRETHLRAMMERPLPPTSRVPPGQALVAATASAARQRLQALVAGDAAIAGAALQPSVPCRSDDQRRLCVEIDATGSEAAVARFFSLAERGPPAVRFRTWQLGPAQGGASQSPVNQDQAGQLRFSGEAMAVWQVAR